MADLTRMIVDHHRPIASHFHTRVDLYAMFIESQIMVDVLLRLIDRRIVRLPVHDAVIISEPDAGTARAVMMEAFMRDTGVEGLVKVET